MIKKIFIPVVLFLSYGDFLFAQSDTRCTTYEYDQYLKSTDLHYAENRKHVEEQLSTYLSSHPGRKSSGTPITVPVVVHIIYNTPDQNISDEQIASQIDVLNEDYASLNANKVQVPSGWAHLVGDVEIRFLLARRDESGNATNGITRTFTTASGFSDLGAVKYDSTGGHNAWDRNHFLNIWVCNITSSILGFAQYPGGPAATDGIVINDKAFGRTGTNLKAQYDLGRTTTHEVGHWFDLYHPWGDDGGSCSGSDHIDDTPNQADHTFGCPDYPLTDACSPSSPGVMFQNYLDYTDDKCMMLFTTDQRDRMNATLNNVRTSILNSLSYTLSVSQLANDLKLTSIDNPVGSICEKTITPSMTVENPGSSSASDFVVEYRVDNDSSHQYTWNGTLLSGGSVQINLPEMSVPEDLHTFIAKIKTVNGGADDFTIDNYRTRSFLYVPGKYTCQALPESPEITFLPNPAADKIYITTLYKEVPNVSFSIYNILGKKIYSTEYLDSNGELITVDVTGLLNGIYFAQVKTFNTAVSKKFIVLH
jgi:hypothetical protein